VLHAEVSLKKKTATFIEYRRMPTILRHCTLPMQIERDNVIIRAIDMLLVEITAFTRRPQLK